jgi:hypothetical protein
MAAETGMAGLFALSISVGAWLRGLKRIAMTRAHWWAYSVLGVLGIHSLLEYPLWYSYFLGIAALLLGALDETRYRLRFSGQLTLLAVLLASALALFQLSFGYQKIKSILAQAPVSNAALDKSRNGLAGMHGSYILSPYADFLASGYLQVNKDHLAKKLSFNADVLRFLPVAQPAYRQAYLLAEDGQIEQAKKLFDQALWSYPGSTAEQQQLVELAKNDPVHFAALLKFALQDEREYASAIHNK